MKKMMTMIAIVLMVGMTQAATVTWMSLDGNTSTMLGALNPAGSTYTTGTVFLYLLTGVANTPTYSSGWNLNGATLVAKGVIDTDGSVLGQAGSWGGSAGGQDVVADALFNSASFYAAVLVTQAGATVLGDVNSGHYYTTTGIKFDTGSLDEANKNGSLFFADTVVAGSWTAVPEPTSMALLALGAAALGLRRKFRA